ncbi:FtsK/SpoIIIE domain-containing protein [Actinoplanes sp. NEAU-A12]|uniref:FtsK/SpoIIIE domain-containing protein n=1 Tax=Actinoplanes sandaracinus TaxID=3045177 RepID=A0ABT6WEM5_9ACTN|nr:FtsK/SpoIIIE domain-containing protein [Actinoplanes sandaracinus]MDI6098189.1 FtsK/SpoIIIE domain-containing protein [Actinoplanes sandaracinus]
MPATARDPLGTSRVPVAPGLSMFDPMFIGIDEFGEHVMLDVVYRNLLIAGEPGGGKSGLINLAASTAALADNTRMVLLDAKFVELGPYRDIADAFIGNDIEAAISVLKRLLTVATNRYQWILSQRRRKVSRDDNLSVILTIIDELAMFSTVLGTKAQQEEFEGLLRGLVSLGRACGMPVVAATQRTSWDIIPASLRDLFGYRCAFRCTTHGSSDVILGQGWADLGYSATDIDPDNRGAAWLLAEGGIPRRIKAAYLTDEQIYNIADYAAWMRRPSGITVPAPSTTSQWEMAA